MSKKLGRTVTFLLSCLITLFCSDVFAANLFLKGGNFFGPGDKGIHPFPAEGAGVRNIELTGPLSGVIPFFNNGPAPPNLLAEILQGGVVDGRASDGTLINENVDTALNLRLSDPITGESANMMVVDVGPETMQPDPKGNVTFNPHVIADPGIPELIVPFSVVFTTGAAKVPLSLKTQHGLSGGHDQAGPFPSGRVLIGRIGDFDQDGLLDGVLVLAQNAPLELVVARGDPIAQQRPWTSDIPISGLEASVLTLLGIVQNFPEPLQETVQTGQLNIALDYLADINERIDAALGNLKRELHAHKHEHEHEQKHSRHSIEHTFKGARKLLRRARHEIDTGAERMEDGHIERGLRDVQEGLELIGIALRQLAALAPAAR